MNKYALVMWPLGQQLLKQDRRWPWQMHVSWLSPLKAVVVVQSLQPLTSTCHGKAVGAGDGMAVVGRMVSAFVGAAEGRPVGSNVGAVGNCVGLTVGVQAPPSPLLLQLPNAQRISPFTASTRRDGQQLE